MDNEHLLKFLEGLSDHVESFKRDVKLEIQKDRTPKSEINENPQATPTATATDIPAGIPSFNPTHEYTKKDNPPATDSNESTVVGNITSEYIPSKQTKQTKQYTRRSKPTATGDDPNAKKTWDFGTTWI